MRQSCAPSCNTEPATPPAATELATVAEPDTNGFRNKQQQRLNNRPASLHQQCKTGRRTQPASLPSNRKQLEVAPAIGTRTMQEDEIEIKGIDTVDMNEAKGKLAL